MKLAYLSKDRFLLADRETFSMAAPSDSNETPMFEGRTEDDCIGEVPVESTITTDQKPTPYLDAIKDFSTYLPHLELLLPQPPPEALKYDKRQPTRTTIADIVDSVVCSPRDTQLPHDLQHSAVSSPHCKTCPTL